MLQIIFSLEMRSSKKQNLTKTYEILKIKETFVPTTVKFSFKNILRKINAFGRKHAYNISWI